MESCLFCDIVSGKIPCHKVWENDSYLAFLTIFPNTPGVTVVVPKAHADSDVLAQAPAALTGLTLAAREVSSRLLRAFPEAGRCALVIEGFGVNHAHTKLYPLHGTAGAEWKPAVFESSKFFEKYEGYVSTHEGVRAPDAELAALAEKIRNA